MSRQEALVTPAIMRWARESARLSPEQVSQRIGQPVEEIEAWERGESNLPKLAEAAGLMPAVHHRLGQHGDSEHD
jgi:DNA-binding transcriptional regulator YiaG